MRISSLPFKIFFGAVVAVLTLGLSACSEPGASTEASQAGEPAITVEGVSFAVTSVDRTPENAQAGTFRIYVAWQGDDRDAATAAVTELLRNGKVLVDGAEHKMLNAFMVTGDTTTSFSVEAVDPPSETAEILLQYDDQIAKVQ
ncbi:MAG: hypothetical protein LBR58_05335 [Propionibacteriaceae bacterium]|jgi:hypothetical protein|nr:hypothetical protein [Propionibacteriaceae bacterium]